MVKAGPAAPRRRKDKPTDTATAPLDGLEAHLRSQLADNKATSGRLSWAQAIKVCWKVTSHQRCANQHFAPVRVRRQAEFGLPDSATCRDQ